MFRSKLILTVAIAAIALIAASLAATGDAFAKGGGGIGHGGGFGHGWGHGWRHGFGYGIVVIDSGCWRWVPGYGKVNVCY